MKPPKLTAQPCIEESTYRLIKKMARQEGRTVYGMVRVMAEFYQEWVAKMETVVHESDNRR